MLSVCGPTRYHLLPCKSQTIVNHEIHTITKNDISTDNSILSRKQPNGLNWHVDLTVTRIPVSSKLNVVAQHGRLTEVISFRHYRFSYFPPVVATTTIVHMLEHSSLRLFASLTACRKSFKSNSFMLTEFLSHLLKLSIDIVI